MQWDAAWTRIDSHPSLVTSYRIDRGRQFELDRTDTGRATVEVMDRHGILDPTNPDGPYHGKLDPLLQATLGRWNPVTEEWQTRFRGFIEEYDYVFDPSQRVNKLTVSLVDIFEILSAIEMQPSEFGDRPPAGSTDEDQVVFFNRRVDDQIIKILGHPKDVPAVGDRREGAGIPAEYYVVFSGNVDVKYTVFSPGESVLSAIQEVADAEFPGVSNVFTDRHGRLCYHGRLAKFDPVGVASASGHEAWVFNQWLAGDQASFDADPLGPTARIRSLAFNRGLSKIINYAYATPSRAGATALTAEEVKGQLVTDDTSTGKYGIRSWSAQDLLTDVGWIDGTDDITETRRFAQYYVNNYKVPRNRITEISFRSMRPGTPGSGNTWELLSKIDIADAATVNVSSPGGGGFHNEVFFVEGIHEECAPLNDEMDDVTVSLDLSPKAYYDSFPSAS